MIEARLDRRLGASVEIATTGYLRPTHHNSSLDEIMFRELVESCPRRDALLSQDEISDLAARAYANSGHIPWDVSALDFGDYFHVNISRTPTDEENVQIYSEIAHSLLLQTNGHRSLPDQCCLMLELAMPFVLLQATKALRLSGPRQHLPAWFWRLGLSRLPHSGLMICPPPS